MFAARAWPGAGLVMMVETMFVVAGMSPIAGCNVTNWDDEAVGEAYGFHYMILL